MTEIGIKFEQSLTVLLSQLDKKEWATPLQALEQKFRQIPDENCSFSLELINLLHQLSEALSLDADTPIEQLAAIRLSALSCWTYRFYRESEGGRYYLDPLTSAVSEFTATIVVVQSSSPFPAIDIIKRWAREHLQ